MWDWNSASIPATYRVDGWRIMIVGHGGSRFCTAAGLTCGFPPWPLMMMIGPLLQRPAMVPSPTIEMQPTSAGDYHPMLDSFGIGRKYPWRHGGF